MRKAILVMAFAIGMTGAYAQKTVKMKKTGNGTEEMTDFEEAETMPLSDKEDARRSPSIGDLFDRLARPVAFNRVVPPYASEVTFSKAVHLILPTAIKYVDLGSADILADKMDGSENMPRVETALRSFSCETDLAVITNNGSYYTLGAKYAGKPIKLNIEMKDSIHSGEVVNRPNNSQEIYLTELSGESPLLVRLIMRSVRDNNKCLVKHVGYKRFGIQYILKGIYTHNGLLYFYTELKNTSNVPFLVDFVTFRVMDKKVAKRTAIQEQAIVPLRAFNYITAVDGRSKKRTISTLLGFTLPNDKRLVTEIDEQNGRRHQRFILANTELIHARVINKPKIK